MDKIKINITATEGYVCDFLRQLATAIEDGCVRYDYEGDYGTAHFDTDMGEDDEIYNNEWDGTLTDDVADAIQRVIGELDGYNSADIENALTELLGRKCNIYDECIDDGADGEDDYVMKGCFEVEDSDITIRVYYGNNTLEIGCVDVREE